MRVGYVVLYVTNTETCARFWVEQVGMQERRRVEAGSFQIIEVGFEGQDFSFQLVPVEMMRANPDNLDLATPSVAFRVENLDALRATLVANGVQVTEVGNARGPRSFAFSDPEGKWFAVLN